MKKKRITYGVSGMMEYQAVIKVGRNNVKVMFADGSVSAMGVNPATFTTENFIVQRAIENSAEFKRGRIKVINTIELAEELRVERNSVNSSVDDDYTPCPTPESTENGAIGVEEGGFRDHTADKGAEACCGGETVAAATQVEFTCNDDAKDYLERTFGFVRSKLRNRDDIINAGKAHNVEITFV